MIARIHALALVLLLLAIILPSSATEYEIPNSPVTVGVMADVPLNITVALEPPVNASRVFKDSVNETWVIPPDKSPYGSFDIIIIPANKPWFWWFW